MDQSDSPRKADQAEPTTLFIQDFLSEDQTTFEATDDQFTDEVARALSQHLL